MKEGWTTRWKALFIWLSGYLSIIAFAIVGGYAIVKSEDEELKKTAKQALIVTVIFTAISMFLSLYNAIGVMTDGYYASAAYEAYSILSQLTAIAKIIVFVVFAAMSFFKGNPTVTAEKAASVKTAENSEAVTAAEQTADGAEADEADEADEAADGAAEK